MLKLDQYILKQLIGPFLFFVLVITILLWVNQALRILVLVTENGQPPVLFLELSGLALPAAFIISLSVGAFAAAVYVINRFHNEGELVVLMTSGQSYAHLVRPFFIFGILCFMVLSLFLHIFTPWSKERLSLRKDQMKREYITQIIQPGRFVSIKDRFTLFIGGKDENSILTDILIEDNLNDKKIVTYMALQGWIKRDFDGMKLVLSQGSIQNYDENYDEFQLVKFDRFSFDLEQLSEDIPPYVVKIREKSSFDIFAQLLSSNLDSENKLSLWVELHDRIIRSILIFFYPVIGMITLLLGGYGRHGIIHRVGIGIVMMIGIDTMRGGTKNIALQSVEFNMIQYTPVFLVFLTVVSLIFIAQNGRRRLRFPKLR